MISPIRAAPVIQPCKAVRSQLNRSESETAARVLRIGIVEPDSGVAQCFRQILTRQGHHVVAIAARGDELVRQCCVEPPDLIITDVAMPGGTGIDAAHALSPDKPIPVIVITKLNVSEVRHRVADSLVVDVLVKPVRSGQLHASIAKAIRKH